jgi:MoaA/NifB/PqqE/SkfB family radical SAM enzyme
MSFHPVYHRFNSLKILAYSERLQQIAEGKWPYPIDWHIYPSNICNHKCTWCMFRQNGEQANFPVKLSRELLLRAVEDAARTGGKLVHFSGGGEPLLNRYTPEAIQSAQEAGLKVALSTNGRLLRPEIAALVDYIRVSLNAGTKEQHWKTNHGADARDPGDWEEILKRIKECAPHKRQDIGLAFVVDYDNWPDIYPFCQVAAECKVDFVHIRPAFYYEPEEDKRTRECMPNAFAECERAKQDFGDKIAIFAITEKFEGYWSPRSYDRCLAVLTGICLRATGDFAVCQDRTDLIFGTNPSYKAGASFEEVWHSEQHRAVVASIVAGGELDKCPRCVWNKRNEIIRYVFMEDAMRLSMV